MKYIILLIVLFMTDFEPIRPQPKQESFLTSQADIVFFGGAAGGGKTYAELLAPLINIDDPNFGALYLRNTRPELTAQGSAWDTSKKIYPRFNSVPNETELKWKFPSGASVKLSAIQYDKDVYAYHSAQIPLIMFDEVTKFSRFQFFYMLSRNRAPTGYNKSCWMLASCNPEPGWVADLIQWWWDPDTGYAIPERSGIIRYFTVGNDDEIEWREAGYRDSRGNKPKSITFIPSSLDDNQILKKNDPGYEANLLAQDYVTRERLLHGNWLITYKGGMFRKEWFKPIQMEDVPKGITTVRYWDWAATEFKENEDPDFTAHSKLGIYGSDTYIINSGHFRESPGTTEKEVLKKAEFDGYDTTVAWEEGKAEMGRFNTHYLSGKLLGYKVHPDRISGSKTDRAKPLASAAEHGHVYYVVDPSWNKDMFIELGQFGSGKGHDDIVDTLTGAFKVLTQTKMVWPDFSSECVQNFTINWDRGDAGTLHYGSFWQSPDNSLYIVSSLWNMKSGNLYVYYAQKYSEINPQVVAMKIVKIMKMKYFAVNKLIASDTMSPEKRGTARLINNELSINEVSNHLSSPTMYDRSGAIAYIGSLITTRSMTIHSTLQEMASQVAGWSYRDEKEPERGYGFCEALCLVGSELKRDISRMATIPPVQDYKPVKQPESVKVTSWQTA